MAKEPKQTEGRDLPKLTREQILAKLQGHYKVGRRVTTPLVSLTYNNHFAFEVEGEMVHQNSALSAKEGNKPMTVCPVIDLSTGESVTLIIPTVLESALMRVPGGYVGKKFLASQGVKKPGKRYFEVELEELEDG